jgi:hypothetical protein
LPGRYPASLLAARYRRAFRTQRYVMFWQQC